jgi:transcriptional antiterminator NusG
MNGSSDLLDNAIPGDERAPASPSAVEATAPDAADAPGGGGASVEGERAAPRGKSGDDGAKSKKLGKAVARKKGEAPKTLTGSGVATSKALMPTTKKGKAAAKAAQDPAAEIKEFDPAADLPMYREGMNWFVLRVASNKESSVRETLLRKVQIEGMEDLVGRIMVPTEKTKTLKAGKHRITETKLYPGYVFVEMKLEPDGRIPQDVFFLIKETSGVGDFVGTAGRPTPMAPHEVEKMLFDSRRPEEAPTVRMDFAKGDAVTIKEGPFQSFTGTVDEVLPDRGLVRVLVTIFGRQAPIELEYWQIARAEPA